MSDIFKPEADRLDQERDVAAGAAEADSDQEAAPALSYPEHSRIEAPEADVLEQAQAVDDYDEEWR